MSFGYYGSPTSGVCDLSWFWLSCLGHVGLLTSKDLKFILASDLLTLTVPDEGYSRNTYSH